MMAGDRLGTIHSPVPHPDIYKLGSRLDSLQRVRIKCFDSFMVEGGKIYGQYSMYLEWSRFPRRQAVPGQGDGGGQKSCLQFPGTPCTPSGYPQRMSCGSMKVRFAVDVVGVATANSEEARRTQGGHQFY